MALRSIRRASKVLSKRHMAQRRTPLLDHVGWPRIVQLNLFKFFRTDSLGRKDLPLGFGCFQLWPYRPTYLIPRRRTRRRLRYLWKTLLECSRRTGCTVWAVTRTCPPLRRKGSCVWRCEDEDDAAQNGNGHEDDEEQSHDEDRAMLGVLCVF